ncbi:VOC family protein [Paracoccus rhizosphaerae]|uniref:VOC family protein n=1 Tax=Paracoccus rhizosphaerae TaxID=1133347 RepID=A0ABV6CP72_9RHOB|nr:VOC family protein [Paracoccus rhizosphaerae]
MTPQRITLVTLGVNNLERAKNFYSALGWTPAPSEAGSIVFYQLNGLVLGLFGLKELAKDQDRPAAELGTGAMTLALNMPDRKAVDTAYQRGLDAGAAPIKAPHEVFWGGYSGYYADLDGHVWEIAHNPYWPLNEDGSLTLPDHA